MIRLHKTHYTPKKLYLNRQLITVCGKNLDEIQIISNDKSLITCKFCLLKLKQKTDTDGDE